MRHVNTGSEDVWTHQWSHARAKGSKVVPDNTVDLLVTEGVDQAYKVANEIGVCELAEVDLFIRSSIPSGCSAVASLIHSHDIIALGS